MLDEPAQPQGRVEPVGLHRVVEVDDRVAGGRAGVRRRGDRPAGQRVEERGLADPGAAHEHHDQQRPVHVEGVALPAEVVGEPLQFGPLDHRQREPPAGVEPRAQLPLQPAEQGGERPQQRRGLDGGGVAGHAIGVSGWGCESPPVAAVGLWAIVTCIRSVE